jgi:hypothetical protein
MKHLKVIAALAVAAALASLVVASATAGIYRPIAAQVRYVVPAYLANAWRKGLQVPASDCFYSNGHKWYSCLALKYGKKADASFELVHPTRCTYIGYVVMYGAIVSKKKMAGC